MNSCPEPDGFQDQVLETVMEALDETGFLDQAVLQGGSCILGCYGGQRISRDLDFAVGDGVDGNTIRDASRLLLERLSSEFGSETVVRPPTDNDSSFVSRWSIAVRQPGTTPDVPKFRTKVEMARVPTITCDSSYWTPNPNANSNIIVYCEGREEILADKIISLTMTESHVRWRDVWDISFLERTARITDKDLILGMCLEKLPVYGYQESKWSEGMNRTIELLDGSKAAQELKIALNRQILGASHTLSDRVANATIHCARNVLESVLALEHDWKHEEER
jgi:predicted nucleotidyltransferase component of viral defense system